MLKRLYNLFCKLAWKGSAKANYLAEWSTWGPFGWASGDMEPYSEAWCGPLHIIYEFGNSYKGPKCTARLKWHFHLYPIIEPLLDKLSRQKFYSRGVNIYYFGRFAIAHSAFHSRSPYEWLWECHKIRIGRWGFGWDVPHQEP